MSAWSPIRRLAAFGAALAVAFGVGLGIGAVGDPIERAPEPAHGGSHEGSSSTGVGGWGIGQDHGGHDWGVTP